MTERILDTARKLYFGYGIRSVSMDDVARECGISKKTLYQHFADRNALVEAVMEALLSAHKKAAADCLADAPNAVAETAEAARTPFRLLAAVNWSFFYELEKYFPTHWEKLMIYTREVLRVQLLNNIARGIDEGLYETNTDRELAVEIRLEQLRTALNPGRFELPASGPMELMRRLTVFYLNAICTAKGRKLVSNYFNKQDEHASTND